MARRAIELRNVADPIDLQKLRDYLLDLYGYAGSKVVEGVVETTDATVTTLLTLPLTDNRTSHIVADVTARRTGGSAGAAGDGASYRIIGTFRRGSAGDATLIGSLTADHTAESQGGWDATLTVSGTDGLVRITGALNNSLSWASIVTVQEV